MLGRDNSFCWDNDGEPCPLTNIHPNIHVPGQTLAINSNRAPRMRSICPLSVCSSGEYVYVTAEPISLPFLCPSHTPYHPRTNLSAYHQMPRESPSIGCTGSNRRFSELIFRQFVWFFRSGEKTSRIETRARTYNDNIYIITNGYDYQTIPINFAFSLPAFVTFVSLRARFFFSIIGQKCSFQRSYQVYITTDSDWGS